MLKSQANYLIEQNPHLSGQIQAGLLLAIAGRVKPIGEPTAGLTRNWEVLGETYEAGKCNVYTVRDLDMIPRRRWSCNCEQGRTYGPVCTDFLERTGHICKHIAAVGILWLECEYPEKPASLWELFSRLVTEQAIYKSAFDGPVRAVVAGESIELPTPHKVKLEYYNQNGKEGLCLKTGKARSEVLARWMPVEGVASGGEWRLVGEAESRYREFVSKINGGSK